MKILAIPATNSTSSINRQLLEFAATVLDNGQTGDVDVEFLDINEFEMPLYSPEREAEGGVPDEARHFFDAIGEADVLMISYAEHNGSYTAAWKNLYDWTSRIDMQVYQGKKVAMLAATPGPRGGAGVLGAATMSAPFFGAELVGSLGIPTFSDNFDAEAGELTNPELRDELAVLLEKLVG